MPDYRKKKHNKLFSAPKPKKQKAVRNAKDEEIKMSPAEKYRKTAQSDMKVVRGKRTEQKRKAKFFLTTVLVIAIVFGILHLAMPMGVFEGISHSLSLVGTGNYPITTDGTQTLNAVDGGAYYYVLSNSFVSAYTNSGKVLFSYPHGFERPVIKISASRALVFEQNGTKALIFTLKGLKNAVDTERNIITANISHSGAYAFVCKSDKYACAVTVYSKYGKMLYEWYSAENTVNNVAVSPNGKKIAVSSFKSENGQYKSVINVLNFKSASPEYTENIDNSLVYDIDSTSRSVFAVVTGNSIEFIKWSDFKKNEYKNDYSITLFRPQRNGFVAVFNRKSDKTDNRIAVFSKKGKLKNELSFKGIISDVSALGGNVYCMSETDLYLLGKEGETLKKTSCGFGAARIAVASSSSVAVISDNSIEKIKLE